MRYLILASLFLVGCGSVPEKETVYETKTVTRLPPGEFLVIPKKVDPVDLNIATEADVAQFIKAVHNRMVQLENNIIGIASFFKDANEPAPEKE